MKDHESAQVVPFKLDVIGEKVDYMQYIVPKFEFTPDGMSHSTDFVIEGWVSVYPAKRNGKEEEYRFVQISPIRWLGAQEILDCIGDRDLYERTSFYIMSRWIHSENFRKSPVDSKTFVKMFLEEIVKQEKARLAKK